MQGKRDFELDDETDTGTARRVSSDPCAQRHVKPMVVALAVAFLVVVGFMIFSKGRPSSARVAGAVYEGQEGIVNLFPQAQFPQGQVSAWRYVAQTYTCPKCGWQGNRLAIDELGNCVCPQCGYCAFKKNVQTARGVDATAAASPNLSVIRPLGMEVKDQLGGVMVCGVYGNSWAERGGVEKGDILIRFNHEDVVYTNQLTDLVAKAPPEKRVPITVLRKGKKVKVDVMVGEGEMEGVVLPTNQPAAGTPAVPATPAAWAQGQGLGLGLGQGGYYAVCPECGFRMFIQRGQACPICPKCNSYMVAEAAMNRGVNQGAAATFQTGQGQNVWCPPR